MPPDVDPYSDRFDDRSQLDAQFSAIISGISEQMQWGATEAELDAAAAHNAGEPAAAPGVVSPEAGATPGPSAPELQSSAGPFYEFDTPETRKQRREWRRIEREEALAAFQEAQAEIQAERDADDAHFEPPPPPPLPKPKGRTVGAVLLILSGVVLLAWPQFLALQPNVTLVFALLLILGGLSLLLFGLRRRRGEAGDGWDDGAVL
jgi:hypothetical protein